MNTAHKLIRHFGGRKEVAAAMKLNPETVRLWTENGIPLDRAIEIERVSKGAVTAEEILAEWRKKPQRPIRRRRAKA